MRGQDPSASKAKQGISDYKKAIGDPGGVAELMLFYCQRAAGFSRAVNPGDTAYLNALVRMFEQVLETTNVLAGNIRSGLLLRLDQVRNICDGIYESICRVCTRTIGMSKVESQLVGNEKSHTCDPNDVAMLTKHGIDPEILLKVMGKI